MAIIPHRLIWYALAAAVFYSPFSSIPAAGCGRTDDRSVECKQAARWVKEGQTYFNRKDYPRAIEQFRSALEACPEQKATELELIRTYLAAREFPQAEKAAKEFLKAEPKSEPGLYLLAYAYFMQEDFRDAGETLKKLLSQNDANPDGHKLMGLTLFFYKEYVMAERELLIAYRQHPDLETLYYLGRVYYTQNNLPPAVKAFLRVIAQDPRQYKAYDNLGLCYEAMGKTGEAARAFQKAQEISRQDDPSYDWAYANLAEMLLKEGRAKESLAYAEQALRINSRSARNHYLVGKALVGVNDLPGAVEHLRSAAELDSQYPEPHYLLGRIYQKLGRQADAQREFALFEKISEASPHKKL